MAIFAAPARLLRDLAILRKLLLAFGVVIVMTLAASGVNLFQIGLIGRSIDGTLRTYDAVAAVDRATVAMAAQESALRGYLLSGENRFLAPIRNGHAEFEAALAEAGRLLAGDPEQTTRLARLRRAAKGWAQEIAGKQIDLMASPETREDARAMEASGVGRQFTDAIRARTAEIREAEFQRLAALRQSQDEAIGATVTVTGMSAAGSILVALGLCLLLTRGIGAAIRRMTVCMTALADGDTAIALEDSDRRDEIGEMARAVDVFRRNAVEAKRLAGERQAEQDARDRRAAIIEESVRGFEQMMVEVLEAVASSSGRLTGTAEDLAGIALRADRETVATAGIAERTSGNAREVAAAAVSVSETLAGISREVEASSTIADRAVETVGGANRTVGSLVEAAQRIGEVVTLISSIAGRTNMLALNATIEAARAGEAGKGFAVVAGEVKQLAGRTARATDEIAGQIDAIQQAASAAVTEIAGISRIIQEMNRTSQAIASAILRQGEATHDICRGIADVSDGIQHVATTISHVTGATGHAGEAADAMREVATDLTRQSSHLRESVMGFLRDVKAA